MENKREVVRGDVRRGADRVQAGGRSGQGLCTRSLT